MTISELKQQLKDAKLDLYFSKAVEFGAGGSGMTSYSDRLTLVTRLTAELNKAIKQEAI